MEKGKFIVIEGGEGAGKGTQINLLKDRFGEDLVITREPGGTPLAEEIRSVIRSDLASDANAKTMMCLFWASRAENLEKVIIPSLKKGKTVIADRFDSSTWAYQIFAQKGQELRDLFLDMRKVYLGEYMPDLYVYLNVDIETGLKRKQEDEISHFETRESDFYERIHEGYLDFFKNVPHHIIDANRSIEEINKDLLKEVGPPPQDLL